MNRLLRARKIGFEDALRGDRIEPGLEARSARSRHAQNPLGFARGEPLVHELRAEAEAAVEALREAAGEPADRVLGAVGVHGDPDHQPRRPPLGDKLPDRGKPHAVLDGGDGGEGVREARLEIADRDADALGAEVKGQDRSGPGERREGRGERSNQAVAWKRTGEKV